MAWQAVHLPCSICSTLYRTSAERGNAAYQEISVADAVGNAQVVVSIVVADVAHACARLTLSGS